MKASADAPLSIGVDAGTRLNKDLVLFGDAWVRPTVGQFGADGGLRVKGNLDLFAGGWADTKGAYSAHAGMKWRF